jgi:DnaJ-class molecular chaperone
MTNYYEILEVSRDATLEEIRAAYRRLALRYHPDKNPGDQVAEKQFKRVAEAYQVLADTEKRQLYDLYGDAGLAGLDASAASRISSTLSGRSSRISSVTGAPKGPRISPNPAPICGSGWC